MSASPAQSATGDSAADNNNNAAGPSFTSSTSSSVSSASSSRRPALARFESSATNSTDSSASSYACRSPKRARSSPSGRGIADTDPVFLDPRTYNAASDLFGTPQPTKQRHALDKSVGRHAASTPPSLPPSLSISLAAPPNLSHLPPAQDWANPLGSPLQSKHSFAAVPPPRKEAGSRNLRRREMSVPLLSQSLSSFSLSQSTPPDGSELSPEALTRALSSSTPPTVATPQTVTDTPRRLPHGRRLHTPAPLKRELKYPNTAPMPVIHSLLGSPFLTKSRPYAYDMGTPTWATRGKGEEPPSALEWQHTPHPPGWLDKSKPQLSPTTTPRVQRRGSSSDEETGSWTSASSLISAEQHASKQLARPSVVDVWGDDLAEDDHPTATPHRPLFSPKAADPQLRSSSRSLHVHGSTPQMRRSPGTPTSDDDNDSPVLRFSRIGRPSIAAGEAEPSRSPSDSFLARRLQPPRRADKRPVSCLLSEPDISSMLAQRRTSEPDSFESGGSFSSFLARCHGERAAKSELATSRRGVTPLPLSSEANDLELDFSPIRPLAKSTVPVLPPRPTLSGLPLSASAPPLANVKPRTALPPMTPGRSNSTRVPNSARVRPGLPRRATAEGPQFHTPVSQLFGDDKPSPAAFASTGLVKKRGGKLNIPRFQDMIKARSWSPMNPADTPSKTETLTDVDSVQLDDWGEQMSPIKPLRTASFGRTSSHARIPSAASDRIALGHARVPSTASSLGGARGLRRKASAMLTSAGSISDGTSEKGSPATPTRSLPFASLQAKYGVTTPSPTTATGNYPFDRRNSMDASPIATPLPNRRLRTLSRGGPVPRGSNPMLATTFRNQADAVVPTTPVESNMPEGFLQQLARIPGAGPFEKNYSLLSAVGEGEFSKVWKVKSKETGDIWAVKTCKPFSGPKNRQRQLEEVTILTKLSKTGHPHIVRFGDSWEQSGRLYIRTEFLDCGDLARYLLSVGDLGGLGEGRVWKMLAELSSALEFIHSHEILHLDLKPSNILISSAGALKVADFGMSVFHSPDADDAMEGFPEPLHGQDHEGDREYLCPEALSDAAPGPEADVYSLGILLLEAALNIALPSNGDAWINLRHDDFTDIDEHYIERGKDDISAIAATAPGDPPPAIVSGMLVKSIKCMMAEDPAERMTLAEMALLRPLARVRAAMAADGDERGPRMDWNGAGGGWRAGPALVEEESGWIEHVLEE